MRFLSLDGWRGIAALFVSIYHLSFYNHIYNWEFLRNSYLFVDFFFVLSGFVITHAYQNKLNESQERFQFIYRRIARLIPLHLFILALFIVLELLKLLMVNMGNWNPDTVPFTEEYSIPSLISNLFLLQSMGLHDQLTWNYPSWSISVEFYTYLIFAITIGISHKNKYLKNTLYFLMILVSIIILFKNVKNLNYATYDFGIFRCIAGFFLGSICYQLFLKYKDIKISQPTLLEMSLIIIIYFFIIYAGENKFSTFAPIIFSLTVFIFSFEQGLISNFLKIRIIQNLGKWSYSIYMLHALIILVIGRGFNVLEKIQNRSFTIEINENTDKSIELFYYSNQFFMDLLTIVYLIALVFVASKTYKHIELKGNKLFK